MRPGSDGSIEMSEHLSIERISAFLDEPWADREAERHLETCDECRAESERLSRMRMALSALGELDPLANEWAKIEARLGAVPAMSGVTPRARPGLGRRLLSNGPLQAAAALALFAGGVLAGLQFTSGTGSPAGGVSPATGELPAVVSAGGEDRAVQNVLSEIEELRAPLRSVSDEGEAGSGDVAADFDAIQAARLAARLDGLIQAMQERLEGAPDDPFASAYLIELMDERARLAEAIERSVYDRRTVAW